MRETKHKCVDNLVVVISSRPSFLGPRGLRARTCYNNLRTLLGLGLSKKRSKHEAEISAALWWPCERSSWQIEMVVCRKAFFFFFVLARFHNHLSRWVCWAPHPPGPDLQCKEKAKEHGHREKMKFCATVQGPDNRFEVPVIDE